MLLRGQARFSKYGAFLFHTMVKDRFPEIEFKFFINTWKSISTTMTDNIDQNTVVYGRDYCQKILTKEEILDHEISPWGGYYSINNETDLFYTVIKIMHYLVHDEKLAKWWVDHTMRYNITYSNMALPSDDWGEISRSKFDLFETTNKLCLENISLKDSAVQMNYNLGQVFSASQSYKLFSEYKSEHPDYQPDLIWSTRLDACHWFKAADQLINLVDNVKHACGKNIDNTVFVDQVYILKNSIAMSDYNFYMNETSAKAFFIGTDYDTVDDNLFALFTKDKHHVLSLIGAGPALQHALWAAYARGCIFRQVNDNLLHETTLLRPSVNLTDIYSLPPTYETFKKIENQSLKYHYPTTNTRPTKEIISESFKQLLDN